MVLLAAVILFGWWLGGAGGALVALLVAKVIDYALAALIERATRE